VLADMPAATPALHRAISDKLKEMIQPQAKTMTLVRWQSRWDLRYRSDVTETVQYLIILALLCALAAVSALKDPLSFVVMFMSS
jgi:hypothetical protein